MEPVPDYYTVLGVAADASRDEIRRAYRRLARMYHPDRNGGSPAYVERMKAINAARDLLSDPHQRAAYDARRTASARAREAARPAEPKASRQETPWVYEDQEQTIRARERRRARDDAWREAAWREAVWQASAAASGTKRARTRITDADLRAIMEAELRRQNPVAGWMGCLAVTLAVCVIAALSLGSLLSSRPVSNGGDRPAAIVDPAPVPALSPADEPRPELCRTILLNPGVLSAATGADGATIVVTMIPDATLSDRISAAWKIDATMDGRLHRGIDDHLASIRVVPSQDDRLSQAPQTPIVLLPGRESWGIRMPDQR